MKTIGIMFQHLHWANQKILETLKKVEGEIPLTRLLFSHILFAEHVWFTRLKGLNSSHLPIWDDLSLEECEKLVMQNYQDFTEFLNGIGEEELEGIISYKNNKGEEFQTSVRDILTHIALHGQYHRGQINQRLRSDHFEPVNTDFITFVR
ncbi:DinB family protein [Bacillus sp. MRMR6]|uniref:DinB family protein n=1 Tax=Bacillus sp. MRMR6 TaxID=1928617 RepID=UPI000950C8F1|nr:DinB family protein [Bacillus sp. MRMR6]OLS33969.1 damage-inducible protein DinB [Bacillus sp. MRMR6]